MSAEEIESPQVFILDPPYSSSKRVDSQLGVIEFLVREVAIYPDDIYLLVGDEWLNGSRGPNRISRIDKEGARKILSLYNLSLSDDSS